MKQTIEVGKHKVELKVIPFIKSMGVKKIIQETLLELFNKKEDEKLTVDNIRNRFYALGEERIEQILKSLSLYINKVDEKTKLSAEYLDLFFSNIDVMDIINMLELIFDGIIPDDDKKK